MLISLKWNAMKENVAQWTLFVIFVLIFFIMGCEYGAGKSNMQVNRCITDYLWQVMR